MRTARLHLTTYKTPLGTKSVLITSEPDSVRFTMHRARFDHRWSLWEIRANGDTVEHYRAGSFRQCVNAARSVFGIRAWNGVTA